MASISEEENIQQEETVRRTRSGRKVSASTPSRNTRRSTRKQAAEQIELNEIDTILEEKKADEDKLEQSDIIKEMLAEAAQGVILDVKSNQPDNQGQGLDTEIIETVDIETTLKDPEEVEMVAQITDSEEQVMPTEEHITPAEDEKSSSFPFGNVPPSENSDGNKTEEIVSSNIVECVDSSLLASLAGDNANSLPSAGEESQSNNNFEVVNASGDEDDEKMGISPPDDDEKIGISPPDDDEKIGISPPDDDDTQSQPAITEDLPNGETESVKTNADVDAEMVSEDELPIPVKPKVTDAEEVSDDELPAPERAELPADTEVVSEDEFPSSSKNKRKASEEYNPSSPTSESTEVPEKKAKVEDEESEMEESKDKKKDKEKEKKKLPELDKYWKAVNDDPADFTGWTYLLQYVDQENDIEAAREAYDAFLAHYPYCYGYWRKYADYEKRKGNRKKCEEVFERGLKAIPLSVDLWIHYLTHVKTTYSDTEEFVRSQFERALTSCGLEFRSDKLWEAFIKWEMEAKRYSHVVKIYDRLLGVPTQGYNGHFDSFQDLINNYPASLTVGSEEFKKLRSEVREAEKTKEKEQKEDIEDVEDEADDHVRNDEEMAAIKEKIISVRRKIHKATVTAVTARWTFEEGIKRPYFHVKPLERCQLKNWKDYLEFEIEKGDRKRILILFERCLIACALYDEFWLKLIRYLESQSDPELIPLTRDAFERACTIHHPDKPSLHLMWSAFEECQTNFSKAAEILQNIEKVCPNLLQIAYRRINIERRRGDFKKCQELYDYYINNAKNKNIAGSLAIKYARFCHKIMGNLEKGFGVLKQMLEKDPSNTRVALQMIDIALQREKVDENEIVQIMDKFMAREAMDPEQKVLFAQRKVEFLEDFGSTAKGLQEAQRALQIALNKANEAKKKSESSPNKKTAKEPANPNSGASSSSTYNNNNYGYGTGTNATTPYYSGNQSYSSYDGYGYNHWQYGSGYSGYGQWSGYGNYY